MSKIGEKILKLLAKAEGTTNANEADAFMAKVHELLLENGLSLMDLGKLGDDPIGADFQAFSTPKYPWIHRVASPLVNYYGCNFVRQEVGPRMVYTVAGRESNRITFALMLPFVQRQVQKLAQDAYKRGHYSSVAKAANAIADATAIRIWRLVPEQKKYEGNGPNALIPVDLIKQELDSLFDEIGKPRESKLKTDRIAMGLAEKVSLYTQVKGDDNLEQIECQS